MRTLISSEELSGNGYAYISDTWNLPKEYYFPDVEIKPYSYMFTFYSETFKGSVSSETFTNSQHPDIVAKYGKISKDQFYIMMKDGTGKISDEEMTALLRKTVDMTPAGIIRKLDLRRPIYSQTARRGHFGVENLPWEQLDLAETLKKAL